MKIMADKKENRNEKGIDDENKTPKTDRRDIAKRWNPLSWFREMERHMMDEFNNAGFGSWLGKEGDFRADSDEIEGKENFTKHPQGKSSGWSYHYQTGMEGPEIRTWGDVKPEDVEKYLADVKQAKPSLGPAKKAGKKEKEDKEPETADGPEVEFEGENEGEWNPFEMFSDIFKGFSEPFFKNMGKYFGGQSEPQLGAVDASQMEPTAETPATPETEEVTKSATEVTPEAETKEVTQSKGGKPVVEPFADVLYDKEGNLVGTLEIPGATEDSLKIAVDGHTIQVEAEGPLRSYRKELQASFKPDPKKVTCHLANGICELRAEKV